tara:strand:+ start:378 stop:653 length:276 start_codon:yes stop_codon:yes gene_type:complete
MRVVMHVILNSGDPNHFYAVTHVQPDHDFYVLAESSPISWMTVRYLISAFDSSVSLPTPPLPSSKSISAAAYWIPARGRDDGGVGLIARAG